MLKKKLFLLLALIIPSFLVAQKATFLGQPMAQKSTDSELTNTFKDWTVYTIPVNDIAAFTKANNGDVEIHFQFGMDFDWQLDMTEMAIVAPNAVTRVVTENGIEEIDAEHPLAMSGYRSGHNADQSTFTVNDGFLYGFVEEGDKTYYIEPLYNFIKDAPDNQVVIYEESSVKINAPHTCGSTERAHRKHAKTTPATSEEKSVSGDCFILDYAIAADFSMYQDHGSNVTQVENQIAGVMANVNTDYDADQFLDQVIFQIVEYFIVTTSGGDPWTSSTDAGQFLDSVTAWGPTGFSMVHDLGGCWTNRDFDGSTVGVAWLGVVCTNSRYHVLQDFSSSAWQLRVLTSHEIGHNFDLGHDGSGGFIMSPSVNNTIDWSTQSINTMEGYIHTRTCLASCPPPNPPTVLFAADEQQVCLGSFVRFFDQSTNSPTSWNWSFPGGIPSSSTEQNPVVQYTSNGNYNVSLTASNNIGPASQTMNSFVNVNSGTDLFFFEGFENGLNGWTVENPDGGTTWTQTAVAGARGNQAFFMDCFNYNAQGQRDRMISPSIDMTNRTDPVIEIEYAYARYNSQFRDSLIVKVSNNGGATWNYVFADTEDGSGNFATAAATTSLFTPAAAGDWCFDGFGSGCLEIDISAFGNNNNVMIQLECYNGFGNSMFIENVGVRSSCAVALPPTADFSANPTSGCAPLSVQFTDQSSGATSWNWQFPGGTPATSTQQNPSVVYNNGGQYSATLTVSNVNGTDSETITNYVNVDDFPVADFNFTGNGLTYNFSNFSTGATNYTWNFGDTQTSNQINPQHTYATDGTYTVTLLAAGPCGSTSTTQTIVIETAPTANFTADVTAGCAPFVVNFSNLSSENATNFDWDFGGGGNPNISTDPNPQVVFENPGVYDITLTVTNGAGSDTYQEFSYIVVLAEPMPNFNTIVNDQIVDFINNSDNADSYFWEFGDNDSSTDPNPVHQYMNDGTYIVTLTAINDCGEISTTQEVEISTQPIANFSASQTAGCAPFTVQFADNSSENTTDWFWEFGNDASPSTSTNPNPTVVYNQAGTYSVTLTVSNSSGDDTYTETNYINVDAAPIADFSANINGSIVDFTNNSTGAIDYFWEFDNDETSNDTNPSVEFADGTYEVTLTAINGCGDVVTTQTITIATPPTAAFTASQTDGCTPFEVQFTNSASENTDSYAWDFGPDATPSTSTDPNPFVTYNQAGTYSVVLTVTNSVGEDTFTETNYINVGEDPTVDFTSSISDLEVTLTNNSSNYDNLEWDFGDNTTSQEVSPTHEYAMDGTYVISLTASNDCGEITTTEEVTIITAPTANFSANTTDGCLPFEVQFSNEASENAVDFLWDFGANADPMTSTDANPIVTFTAVGTYSVSLTVTNAAGTDTYTEMNYIVVDDVPTADFNAVPNELSVDFNNTSSNGNSYSWDFGDMNTSDEENPTHVYEEEGTFTVTLTVSNDCGDVMTTQDVTVSLEPVPPTAAFEASATSGCTPFEVQFTDNSSENTESWLWDFGPDAMPSTSTEQNPVVIFNAVGTYSVTLTASNVAGESTFSETNYIVVNTVPTANFTSTVDGLNVDFTNNADNYDTVEWDFGDDETSNEITPSHTYAEDGTYTVILTASNACGSVTFEEVLTIITPPLAGFSADITAACAPVEIQFTDNSSENTTNWAWNFGPDAMPSTSTEQNPIVTFTSAGTYSVTLVASNAAGESTFTETDYIVIDAAPTVDFTAVPNELTVNFTNNSTNTTTYSWDFGDDTTSDVENPIHEYAEEGTYTVTLTVSNDCGEVTTTQDIFVSLAPVPPTASFTASATSGCTPFEVQFTDNSSENTENWLWNFGPDAMPSTSTEQNPVVTYATAGTYTVTLTASNVAGESTVTETNYIIVDSAPTVDFTAVPNELTVNFTNNSTNTTTYSWDFGDDTTSDVENPIHEYAEEGTYTVTLTVSNDCGEVTTTQDIFVSLAPVPPTASFTADVTTGCVPFEVQFTDNSSENTENWLWDFGAGATPMTSTAQNPIVTFATAGTYSVTLTASNIAGESTTTEMNYITVLDVPSTFFNSNVAGATVTFTNNSTNFTSLSWDFGDDVTSDEENPMHTYLEDGTYVVTLVATNDCGSTTFTETVVIATQGPIAGFEAAEQFGCAPFMVQFNNLSSENATSFEWSFPGGMPAFSMEENPVVTYNNAGTYEVTLIACNDVDCDTYTLTNYIEVEEAPNAAFTYTSDMLTVDFTNLSTSIGSVTWDFGDNTTSNVLDPIHTYDVAGVYQVELTVTNECGTSTETIEVVVDLALPSANFEADDRDGCIPHTIQFMDMSTNNPTEWLWSFPGADTETSTEQNPSITYSTPGEYSVTLQASNVLGGNTITKDLYVSIIDVPVADFTADVDGDLLTVMFENTSTFSNEQTWDFGDNTTSDGNMPTHVYAETGVYTVTLTVVNDCGEDTTTQTIEVKPNSIETLDFVNDFRLFPNPNDGQFTIQLTGEAFSEDLNIQVINVLGQIMYQQTASFGTGRLEQDFDFSDAAAGVYFVKISADNRSMYRKVIIE